MTTNTEYIWLTNGTPKRMRCLLKAANELGYDAKLERPKKPYITNDYGFYIRVDVKEELGDMWRLYYRMAEELRIKEKNL